METPTVSKWFAGKNILITGATGFLGKVLIEKLLRSCPNIGNIYILMRPKRGKQLSERLELLINEVVYERVKREQPKLQMSKKIIPLAGEITQLGLGLSPEDRKTITDNVNIIYHVAASVRFDDSLRDATFMNIRGTREVCQLALDTKNLEVHVHVSTAFANCDKAEAKEVLYPPLIDWRKMIEIAETFDLYQLEALSDKILNDMPNTYCFSKNVAEHVAFDMLQGKVPTKIFRPSIVVATMKEEPVAGWIDNFNGPVGILVAYGKGIMRTIYAHDQYKPDYIPVDVVTKALVVSTWDLGIRGNNKEPEIMHCTSYNVAEWCCPNLKQLAIHAIAINEETPLNDIMWVPSTHTTTSPFIWYLRTILFMLIPSLILDGLLKLAGKKPMLTKLQRKMFIAQISLRYFLNNEWIYRNDNLLALLARIKPCDMTSWDYNFKDFDFATYVRQSILGSRRYLLHESDETLPRARKHYARMKRVQSFVQVVALVIFLWLLWNTGMVHSGYRRLPFY